MARRTIRMGVDPSKGHGCFPPRPLVEGSKDCFTNSIKTTRVGDKYAKHCCGFSCHGAVAAQGSNDLFINLKMHHRTGDAISCGDFADNGSLDCIPNDLGR